MAERTIRAIGSMALTVGLIASACSSPPSPPPATLATSTALPSGPAGSPQVPDGSSSQSAAASRSSSAFGTDFFTGPATPLDLTMTPDPTRVATAHITSAGGTIKATGADGTTFVLEIPARGLLADADLVLTPVATIAGWDTQPTGAVGVQMQPDGLVFAAPGRLVITPGAARGDARGEAFSFGADGKDAHLVLRERDTAVIAIPIRHFSGAGFTWESTESFWTNFTRYRQERAEDRLSHRLAVEIGLLGDRERRGLSDPSDRSAEDVYQAVRHEYERDVIGGRLTLAERSCKDAKRALAAYGEWNHNMGVLERDDLALEVPPQLRVLARYVCAEEETRDCFETGDQDKLVSALLADEAENQVGYQGLPVGALRAYAEACGRFDLVIEQHSEGIIGGSNGWDLQADIEITIPLRWVADAQFGLIGDLEGEAIGEVTDASGVAGPCKITLTTGMGDTPYEGKITKLKFNHGPENESTDVKEVILEFTEGHATIGGVMKCPKVPAFKLPAIDVPFVFNADPMFKITGWKPGSHPKIATKDKERVFSGGVIGLENLSLKLVHTPGDMPVRPPIL